MKEDGINLEERVFSLADLGGHFCKYFRQILLAGCLGSVFVFLCLLSKPVSYVIQATFKEGRGQNSELGQCSQAILGFSAANASLPQTASLMKSYSVLFPLVKNMGLQVREEAGRSFWFSCVKERLLAERKVPLRDVESVQFSNVEYQGEQSLFFSLRSINSDFFEIFFQGHLFEGRVGERLDLGDASFCIDYVPQNNNNKSFKRFSISSWKEICDVLKKQIKICPQKSASSIYDLSISHRDRLLGVCILNNLMQEYERALKREHDQMMSEHLIYLEGRQKEVQKSFNEALSEYMQFLSKSLREKGFIGSDENSNVLQQMYGDLIGQSFLDEMEIDLINTEDCYLKHVSEDFRRHISSMEQERDLLEENFKENISAYLKHQDKTPKLLAGTLQKEDPFQGSEFVGLDLQAAKQLLAETSRQLDTASLQRKFYQNSLECIRDESCDLSICSTTLQDPLSEKVLQNISQIYFRLKEDEIFSHKEKEKYQEELTWQKKILKEHVNQMIEMEEVKINLYQNKMISLQKVCFDCLQKSISVGYEKVLEFATRKKETLLHQRKIAEERLRLLREDMASYLPVQFRMERMLELKSKLALEIIEQVASLVESKTIGKHLHRVESKPLDAAVPPLHPEKPRLLLGSILGGILGACWCFVGRFFLALYRGIPVSFGNLQALRYPVLGKISQPMGIKISEDRETLRKACIRLQNSSCIAGLLLNKGPNYGSLFASLLAKSGKKVLLICCDFTKELDQKTAEPPLFSSCIQTGEYDSLSSEKIAQFGLELLHTKQWKEFLRAQKDVYDTILLWNESSIHSAETEVLLQMCDVVFATVSKEAIHELTPLMQWGYHEKKCRINLIFSNTP